MKNYWYKYKLSKNEPNKKALTQIFDMLTTLSFSHLNKKYKWKMKINLCYILDAHKKLRNLLKVFTHVY